jgi:predicted RNase H-like nuclease (RuvC/YqgF family)
MDTQLISHVGGELVVIAGISIYFYKRTSSLEQRIQELEKDNEELIKAVEYMNLQIRQITKLLNPKDKNIPQPLFVPTQSKPEPKTEPKVEQEAESESDLDEELQEEISELEKNRELTDKVEGNCVNGMCSLD